MKFGFSPIRGDGNYAEALEEVEYAEANGLDSVFLQEHHEAEVDQYWSDPLSVLTGLATRTDDIQLGTAILLLPLYHPVRLAERDDTGWDFRRSFRPRTGRGVPPPPRVRTLSGRSR